ncbi:MAG: hypothetical protein KKF65_02980 [Nanoarchaeota archaeon]|nr:hypothetical protein [Nanoarchaeota archaeon]
MIIMSNITLAIPEETYNEMKQFSEVRWSEVARKAIIHKLELLRITEKLAEKSELTKKDIEEFSKKIKKEANKKFL